MNQYNSVQQDSRWLPQQYASQLNAHGVTPAEFSSQGFAEMNSSCKVSPFKFEPSVFLSDLDDATGAYGSLPASLSYKFMAGEFQPPFLFRFADSSGTVLGDRNGSLCSLFADSQTSEIYTDGIVPLNSATPPSQSADPPIATPNAFRQIQSTKLFINHTARAHWEETEDLANILCALSSNCLVAAAHSPVDLEVTQSDGTKIGVNVVEIPGASYDVIHDSPTHDTSVVTIPFPTPGIYTIKAIPKTGSSPSDTYSISVVQNGSSIWLAQNVPVSSIPAAGYLLRPNGAPVPSISGPATVQATGPSGAFVTLRGTAVDPDSDAVSLRWTGSFGDVAGNVLATTLPVGTNRVVLVATDSHGASGTAVFQVAVTPQPFVSFGGSPQTPVQRDSAGNFLVNVSVTNQGNVTVNSFKVSAVTTALGTTAPSLSPAAVTNLAPGASTTITLTFPKTAASASATSAPLKVGGTYTAGSLSGNWTLTFRSVALSH
jgi:hypothetical protein